MIGNVTMINADGVEKNSYNDFGLIIKSKIISAPEPQIHKVEIIGRDGSVDLSDILTGTVRYKDRNIKLVFRYLGAENTRTAMLTEFQTFAHGKLIKFIFNDDLSYFWRGRIISGEPTVVDNLAMDNSTSCVVEPYKYDILSTGEDWLWDPFDFEIGVINEMHNLIIEGSLTVMFIGSPYQDNPTITVSDPMTVSYDGGEPISLVAGTQKVYDIVITSGEHTFTFTGTGIATIDYRGGTL